MSGHDSLFHGLYCDADTSEKESADKCKGY